MIYVTCKSVLAAHELSLHPSGLKQMKTGPNMDTPSWKETQMGVGWDWYLRQLCLIFNFTGGILNGAGCKPLRDIIFLYLVQRCDILAARWEHPLCRSKGQKQCQPGRLRRAHPEGGSHDDVPQSPLQLSQISNDLHPGWHPGPRGRRAASTLHKHLSKTIAMGRGEDADTWVSVTLQKLLLTYSRGKESNEAQ